jgi:hypothetical protein
MSDDLVKRADSFRLGASPTPDDVNEANWLIDRMSARIEELEAQIAAMDEGLTAVHMAVLAGINQS